MRIERVFLEKITTVQLNIGYAGEHDHCRVIIDSASLLAYYPNAVAGMVAKSPAGVLYPIILQQDGNDVIWNVSDSDLARAGVGTFQLTFTQNGEIIKTAHGSYKVDPSLLAEGDPPDPIETWIDEANQKLAEVTEAVQEATEAAENADSKASEAEEATSDANAAATLANEKATLADQKATLAATAASSANTAAASATSAASDATSAASSANTAASTANTAAGKIDNMTVAASSSQTPTATITEVDGHKHILFGIVKGDAGKDFHIAKTFSSIAQMMAYTGTDIEAYDFAMIDTGSVQDPDTGKLYCYEPETQERWRYIGDLSGAQGIKGETGTGISSIALNQDYTLTIYLDDGTSYTTTSIRGAKGDPGDPGTPGTPGDPGPAGQNAYVYIRYSTFEPVQDADMHTTPDNWMGIYSGTSSTAPTAYTDYAWYKIKGETGSATNVYGTTVPMSEQDSTKVATAIGNKLDANQGSANAGKFMKVGNDGGLVPDTVPDPTGKADKVQNATSGNFAGLDSNGNLTDSGSKASDFGTYSKPSGGIPSTDLADTYIEEPSSEGTNGQVLTTDGNGGRSWQTVQGGGSVNDVQVDGTSVVTSGTANIPIGSWNRFGVYKANADYGITTHGDYGILQLSVPTDNEIKAGTSQYKPIVPYNQHTSIYYGLSKLAGADLSSETVTVGTYPPASKAAIKTMLGVTDMTGATSSTAGANGLAPAPSAGDQNKVLTGGGTWEESPGAKVYTTSALTITNTSGSFSQSFSDENIGSDMQAIRLEIADPSVFNDDITITPGNGTVTVACSDVAGTTTMKISLQKVIADPTAVTSTEFTILNNRLLAVENVCTDTPISIATTDWTSVTGGYSYTWESDLVTTPSEIEVFLRDGAENAGIEEFDYDKVTGGVQFTVSSIPTASLPVTIRVINAKADAFQSLTGEDIATDVITGATNVDEALTALNGKINSIGDDYTLLGTIVASGSGWRTKDITSLSGYRFIMIALGINGGSGSFSTEFIPISYLKTFTSSTNFCAANFHFGNNDVQFSYYYISDTSLGINTDGMSASVNAAKIYGIK